MNNVRITGIPEKEGEDQCGDGCHPSLEVWDEEDMRWIEIDSVRTQYREPKYEYHFR